MNVKVNRWLDLLDRVGWTFLQAFAGTMLVLGFNDWEDSLKASAAAAVIAVVKVLAAQQAGSNDLGSAVPGQVLEATTPVNPATVR
jgi:hypothetical protein